MLVGTFEAFSGEDVCDLEDDDVRPEDFGDMSPLVLSSATPLLDEETGTDLAGPAISVANLSKAFISFEH
jgi:hypothetical protein